MISYNSNESSTAMVLRAARLGSRSLQAYIGPGTVIPVQDAVVMATVQSVIGAKIDNVTVLANDDQLHLSWSMTWDETTTTDDLLKVGGGTASTWKLTDEDLELAAKHLKKSEVVPGLPYHFFIQAGSATPEELKWVAFNTAGEKIHVAEVPVPLSMAGGVISSELEPSGKFHNSWKRSVLEWLKLSGLKSEFADSTKWLIGSSVRGLQGVRDSHVVPLSADADAKLSAWSVQYTSDIVHAVALRMQTLSEVGAIRKLRGELTSLQHKGREAHAEKPLLTFGEVQIALDVRGAVRNAETAASLLAEADGAVAAPRPPRRERRRHRQKSEDEAQAPAPASEPTAVTADVQPPAAASEPGASEVMESWALVTSGQITLEEFAQRHPAQKLTHWSHGNPAAQNLASAFAGWAKMPAVTAEFTEADRVGIDEHSAVPTLSVLRSK